MAARSFGNTADMMRVFEEAFDYLYPFEKYAQITVHDFRWGGMENTGATTLTIHTLHDEAAYLTSRRTPWSPTNSVTSGSGIY